MSKHNNSMSPSMAGKCKCGRYITIGEEKAGINPFTYECPDCFHHRHSKPISREQYYSSFNLKSDANINRS